jgi:hypothetical protein
VSERVMIHDDDASACVDVVDGCLLLTTADRDQLLQVRFDREDEDRLRQLLVERANQAGER